MFSFCLCFELIKEVHKSIHLFAFIFLELLFLSLKQKTSPQNLKLEEKGLQWGKAAPLQIVNTMVNNF